MARSMSFDEIAKIEGISRQRVEQIYASAIRKLKRNITDDFPLGLNRVHWVQFADELVPGETPAQGARGAAALAERRLLRSMEARRREHQQRRSRALEERTLWITNQFGRASL